MPVRALVKVFEEMFVKVFAEVFVKGLVRDLHVNETYTCNIKYTKLLKYTKIHKLQNTNYGIYT